MAAAGIVVEAAKLYCQGDHGHGGEGKHAGNMLSSLYLDLGLSSEAGEE